MFIEDNNKEDIPSKTVFTSREARDVTTKNIERLNDINMRFVNKINNI